MKPSLVFVSVDALHYSARHSYPADAASKSIPFDFDKERDLLGNQIPVARQLADSKWEKVDYNGDSNEKFARVVEELLRKMDQDNKGIKAKIRRWIIRQLGEDAFDS